MNKTKAQLETEIKELRLELENQSKHDKYFETAQNVYDIYLSFTAVGFTEAQAWEIIKLQILKGGQ
jgi:hypothetical protein